MSNPLVERIQKGIKNRNAAVSILLVSVIAAIVGIVVLFGSEIIQDVKRLNNGIQIFISDHEQEIDEGNQQIKSYIESIYSFDELEQQIETSAQNEADSLAEGAHMEELQSALSGLTSFIGGSDEAGDAVEEDTGRSLNWIIIFFSSIGYFIYILFTYEYFQEKSRKYFGGDIKQSKGIARFIGDFKRIFLDYFRQRSKIVGINFLIFLTTFLILDLPGAIMIAVIAAALTYIAHFHYLALIPLSLSCWIVAMETGNSFFLFFGIVAGAFVLVSILEELLMYPRFMKKYDTLNPAIMLVSLCCMDAYFWRCNRNLNRIAIDYRHVDLSGSIAIVLESEYDGV